MNDPTRDYREYLELFGYFGRGGMNQLSREEFIELSQEFSELVAKKGNLSGGEIRRVAELKDLLFRDRPRLEELR